MTITQALVWFRRATAVSQFAREAISAAASMRAAQIALGVSSALKQGRAGAGRHVMALAAVAYAFALPSLCTGDIRDAIRYAARLAGQLPMATKLYRRALVLAESLVGGSVRASLAAASSSAIDDDDKVRPYALLFVVRYLIAL
jgi:hypothetical protein